MRREPKTSNAVSKGTTMPSSANLKKVSKSKKHEVKEPIASVPPPQDIEEDENSTNDEEDSEEDSDAEEEVPLSDLDSNASDAQDIDIVPYTKLHKDNHAALTQALSTFALPLTTIPFHIHQSFTSPATDEE